MNALKLGTFKTPLARTVWDFWKISRDQDFIDWFELEIYGENSSIDYEKNPNNYPFSANYLTIGDTRIHYLDEGPVDGKIIYLLHGEPAWSYLFRKMIPTLTAAGYRVIAPDMVGFGKSDKYISIDDYSHQMHVDKMVQLVRELDLKDVTAHLHDWGGLVGFRVIAEEPERFSRIIASNTSLIAPGRGFLRDLLSHISYPLFKLGIWIQGPATWEEFIYLT